MLNRCMKPSVKCWSSISRKHDIDLLKEVQTLSGAANKILHRFNKGEAVLLFTEKQRICINWGESKMSEDQFWFWAHMRKLVKVLLATVWFNPWSTKTLTLCICMPLVWIFLQGRSQLTNETKRDFHNTNAIRTLRIGARIRSVLYTQALAGLSNVYSFVPLFSSSCYHRKIRAWWLFYEL